MRLGNPFAFSKHYAPPGGFAAEQLSSRTGEYIKPGSTASPLLYRSLSLLKLNEQK